MVLYAAKYIVIIFKMLYCCAAGNGSFPKSDTVRWNNDETENTSCTSGDRPPNKKKTPGKYTGTQTVCVQRSHYAIRMA